MNDSAGLTLDTPEGPLTRLELAQRLRGLAITAGAAIMPFFKSGADVRQKADDSPVTDADEAAEAVILDGLRALTPDIPVIAEEAMAAGTRPEIGESFYLVDPLDGTKEFISGRGEFTVNIALVMHGKPVVGVVFAPALKRLFLGAVPGGAFEESVAPGVEAGAPQLRPIAARSAPEAGIVAVASRSHRAPETETYLEQFKVASFVSAGSSLKFCLVATGEADLYPRHGRTMEWDTAAGHAVLAAAGGTVTTFEGPPLVYGKEAEGFANPFFVARGRNG